MSSNKFKDVIKIPKVIEKPLGNRILVLAPHFDDMVLGVGGTIIKHLKAKDKISIIYITDSSRGISDKNGEETKIIRKKEAEKAWNILGIKSTYLLNEKDGESKTKKETIRNIIKIFEKEKPDLVYLPSFLDNHKDHLKTNRILQMVSKYYKKDFKICAYEIWTPLPFPNIIVNINKEFKTKEKAIRCFKSQLREVDYLSTIKGLNKYRSIYNLKGEVYAEAFLLLNKRDYLQKIK